ncbi:MAG TPA: MBOAT family protein [Desulfobulbaceae bacterium]|nr:MBOAT family protein [Desulfobulbaceae bacterium]
MVFSSIIFLFLFLPVTLVLELIVGRRPRNTLLLAASLIFYAWGEGLYVLMMLGSITLNYLFGLLIGRTQTEEGQKALLALAVVLNLLPLFYFKYTVFALENVAKVFAFLHIDHTLTLDPIHLPIGISFFTFQALSYIVDVYRKTVAPQKNILDMGLFIALFPQLIAGPIVRYHDIAQQLKNRSVSVEDFASGAERFVHGLGKKVLLANPMGAMADQIFSLQIGELSSPAAWLGVICYSLQIYFDFSGYSDMAIGLGRMFGFHFLENFNYPYISRSIREFWRRWHISLSNWFRDYLYIPLGGNRKGPGRTGLNLLIVFFLCGFWHGASWNFICWGLCHGFFLVLERGRTGRWLSRSPALVQHLYTLLVVANAWVFFRAETLEQGLRYLGVMYGIHAAPVLYPLVAINLDAEFFTTMALGLLIATPVYPVVEQYLRQKRDHLPAGQGLAVAAPLVKLCLMGLLLLLSSMNLATGAYNPFIYFRF